MVRLPSPLVTNRQLEMAVPGFPAPRKERQHKRIVFGWYGGKFNHLDWLLPLLS